MKKSKHFRKDVIMARIIAAALLVILIAILVFAISLFTKPSGSDKNSQNTESSQNAKPGNDELEDTENEGDFKDTEGSKPDVNVDSESEDEEQIYVETTTQVKLREEPNTNCATLDRIDGGTKLLVLESLDGWYKVTHNGQTGYVSADYVKVVEE